MWISFVSKYNGERRAPFLSGELGLSGIKQDQKELLKETDESKRNAERIINQWNIWAPNKNSYI